MDDLSVWFVKTRNVKKIRRMIQWTSPTTAILRLWNNQTVSKFHRMTYEHVFDVEPNSFESIRGHQFTNFLEAPPILYIIYCTASIHMEHSTYCQSKLKCCDAD